MRARDTSEPFGVLAEALPLVVWFCTRDGTLEHMNARGLHFFGLPFAELARQLGRAEVVPAGDQEWVLTAWHGALAGHATFDIETRLRRFDGVMRWHAVHAQPVLSATGEVVQWIGTATDIHEAKESTERTAFLLALSSELACTRNPQELLCAAMARLRSHLGVSRVTLAELDEEHE